MYFPLSQCEIPNFCDWFLSITPWIYQKSKQASVCKITKFSIRNFGTNIKKTHMWRRWGTPQNFLLAFTDELWKTWKIKILKKWKKKNAQDIMILHMCTKNHNHMRYRSSYTEWDKNFYHFGPFSAPLPPPPPLSPLKTTTQKTKILKKLKKDLEMSSF